MQPTPLSEAPMPTSHESKWQPTSTISFGSSRPTISPNTLADSASGSMWASIFRRTRTVNPRSVSRWIRLASSAAMAAVGIFVTPSA